MIVKCIYNLLSHLIQLMKNRILQIQKERILNCDSELYLTFYSNETGTVVTLFKILDSCLTKNQTIILKQTKDIMNKIKNSWETMDMLLVKWFQESQREIVQQFIKSLNQLETLNLSTNAETATTIYFN